MSPSPLNSLVVYGAARPDLLRPEILADLFEATAARVPEQTALIFGEYQLNYGELNQRADNAAAHLLAAGVGPGALVGLWLPRGLELLVLQLAIAKTGAGWLPCDADTPIERVNICLEDAQAIGIICTGAHPELRTTAWSPEQLLAPAPQGRRREQVDPNAPAYVIYTSGSTGKPKGIAITQASICHFLRSENAILGIRDSDKVYQGFSVAFDMSFEEIWISYLVGATLWLAPKELAGNPEELPHALRDQQVTVLHAVPTLLALFAQDIPSLRLINLGGEMCPESLVARWDKPGRQIFNTYGPTEGTVSASLAQLRAGTPVTIGTPLPNYGLLVIAADVENGLRLQPQGEVGELCIIGPGVAQGYLGRPELTAEKFLANPWASSPLYERLYRTGDLARIDEQGQVHCLGRADDQIKIRGFRVELGEIEAVLARQPGVGTTAVILRQDGGRDQLVAFIVTEGQLDITQARQALAAILPPYMVPGRFEVLTEMPRLTSGKIDRKALKALPLMAQTQLPAGSDSPASEGETALFAALTQLFPGQPIKREQDFFNDLGGHSLLAAALASQLRTDPRFELITLRDLYQQRQLQRIAERLDGLLDKAQASTHLDDWTPPPAHRRWLCGCAQALAIPPLVALRMVQWLTPFFTYHFFTGDDGDSIPFAVLASVAMFTLATLLEFVITLAGKWLLVGRLKPGQYPLWGITYFRWWLADRLIGSAPVYLLAGSSLYSWWLRALGARIGKDVQIGSITLRAPDLLQIDDGASIGNAVNLENARVERGQLVLGNISIGSDAHIGSYSVVEGNTVVGSWGQLDAQSALHDGYTIPAERHWGGSPARDLGATDHTPPARVAPKNTQLVGELVYFTLAALFVSILFFVPVFPTFMLIDWLDVLNQLSWAHDKGPVLQLLAYFALALPASALLVVITALLSAAIRWGVLPRMHAGSWPVHSLMYCRKWLVNQIQENSLHVLHGVYATVYSPFWYRLLGAKVGRNAEISTALGVVPDMLNLGDETFIADAVMLGDEEVKNGWLRIQPTHIGARSFVGNGSYIPDGTRIPANLLIGVLSSPPAADKMQPGDTWVGTPPLLLPAREILQGFPEALTYKPSPLRRLARALVEAFRIMVPHAIIIAVGYTIVLRDMPVAADGHWLAVLGDLVYAGLLFGLGTFLFVAAFKWLLLGRYQRTLAPMWTPFVWLSEAATNLYEGIAVPNFMNYLRGTPWLPIAFRVLGCKIGRGVYMDTTDITEFDCAQIGDHSEINALTCPQTHLFEDRIMKIDRVVIGRKVYIGPRSIVLYGANVGDGARIGPLTLVMKGEQIPARSAWSGCPATPD